MLNQAAALARRASLIAAAVCALTAAATVFLVALYHWLRRDLLAEEALAVVAGILLVTGLVLLFVARQPRTPSAAPVAATADPLAQTINNAVANDPLGAAFAALALGFLTDSQPELGRTITNFLKRR